MKWMASPEAQNKADAAQDSAWDDLQKNSRTRTEASWSPKLNLPKTTPPAQKYFSKTAQHHCRACSVQTENIGANV